jgi:single-stranded DNA-binding protein
MAKGQRVTVSGPIKLEAYTAKDGTAKTRLRLSVDQIDLPPKGSDAPAQTQQTQQPQSAPAGAMADMDDDIPF